jgi:hypothetical protein
VFSDLYSHINDVLHMNAVKCLFASKMQTNGLAGKYPRCQMARGILVSYHSCVIQISTLMVVVKEIRDNIKHAVTILFIHGIS